MYKMGENIQNTETVNTKKKVIFTTLFFSLFVTVTGAGIVVPLLPMYAKNLGASGLYIGFIFGAFSLSRTLLLPYFGRLSDKKGRKIFIVTGLFCYTIISFIFLFATNVTLLILVRFIQGIFSAMIMPVTQAYIGDITPKGREGFTMGCFNMSIFAGLSLGPLLGGVINEQYSLNMSFACMGILSFIGFLMSFFILPKVSSEKIVKKIKKNIKWKELIFDRTIISIFFFRFSFLICVGTIWAFLPIFADSEINLSTSHIGILIMLTVLISGLTHIPMGYIADKVDKKAMIIVGGIFTAFSILSYIWADSIWDLVVANIIFGLGGGIATPPLFAIAVIKGNETDAMGSVMAILTMAHSLGMLIGSFLAGLIMDIFHLRFSFFAGAIILIMGTIFFGCCYKKNSLTN